MIEEIFRAPLKPGKLWEARASRGNQVLQRMIEDGRRGATPRAKFPWCRTPRPIASSGLLFMNTLFDENAACHIALGPGLQHLCERWRQALTGTTRITRS